MVSSKAATVKDYLSELPAERRRDIARVRAVIRQNLPAGYKEMMLFGAIAYCIPLSRYRVTYNGAPLVYAGLAAQKNYNAVYLMGIYADAGLRKWFEAGYKKSGKKLDVGKCCVRFKTLDDLPLTLIGDAIARMPSETFIARYEQTRGKSKRKTATARAIKAERNT